MLTEAPLAKAKPGDLADVAFMKGDAATLFANGNIRAGRHCVADVRAKYQGKKP